MKFSFRYIQDKIFTGFATGAAGLLVVVLLLVLTPMVYRGTKAVVFQGTIEYRKMQLDVFGRGDIEVIATEKAKAQQVRDKLYAMIEGFKKGLDVDVLSGRAKNIYRNYGKEIRDKELASEEFRRRRELSRKIRNELMTAFSLSDKEQIKAHLDNVLGYKDNTDFEGTSAKDFFALAEEFSEIVENIDLKRRKEYANSLGEIEGAVLKLLGPLPGDAVPALVQDRYGCTRMDMAKVQIDRVLYSQRWVSQANNDSLVKVKISRVQQFAGTEMARLFDFVENNADAMLMPKSTFYWQYFIDDSTAGHYFGGVGHEIIGTLLLTIVAMLFAFPLGVISAAYLVECASDGPVTRIVRMCINSLAGVPSVVFGLFGLAFFVLYLLPLMGALSKGCVLTASLTLGVLTLPVMIRASEEAIRAVPKTYKEASLGLGATGLRTFVKVTLPAAMPGILTGVILSISRVAGETAPVLFTGAVALGPLPKSLFDPARTLSYGSYDIAVGDRLAMQVPHNQYGMVVTLVLLIIVLNTAAIFLRAKIFKKLKGL
ncbi:MAG: phosphate ABC transporter permease PstA [Anaerohalosphaeraceae bacterium]|nr:phosphate ABC transporter permease PstA [Anaerohalosphaeraceae bacterium]